jgi:hypothetical protein
VVLSRLVSGLGLNDTEPGATWMTSAAASLPQDVTLPSASMDEVSPGFSSRFVDIAARWGYR